MTLIGIINQLFQAQAKVILAPTGLPLGRFSILHHLCHNPARRWTIGELARVMDLNQPATTKLIQKLEAQGFVKSDGDASDKRIKRIVITPTGISARNHAISLLGPDIVAAFDKLDTATIDQVSRSLEHIKNWLDENRRSTA